MNKTHRQYLYESADWSCFGSEFSDDVTAADPLNTMSYYTVEHNASKAEGSPSDLRLLAEVYQKLIYRASQNPATKAYAKEARENLLKAGRFEYLHLEED